MEEGCLTCVRMCTCHSILTYRDSVTQEIEYRAVDLVKLIVLRYARPGEIKVRIFAENAQAGTDSMSCSGQEITVL